MLSRRVKRAAADRAPVLRVGRCVRLLVGVLPRMRVCRVHEATADIAAFLTRRWGLVVIGHKLFHLYPEYRQWIPARSAGVLGGRMKRTAADRASLSTRGRRGRRRWFHLWQRMLARRVERAPADGAALVARRCGLLLLFLRQHGRPDHFCWIAERREPSNTTRVSPNPLRSTTAFDVCSLTGTHAMDSASAADSSTFQSSLPAALSGCLTSPEAWRRRRRWRGRRRRC